MPWGVAPLPKRLDPIQTFPLNCFPINRLYALPCKQVSTSIGRVVLHKNPTFLHKTVLNFFHGKMSVLLTFHPSPPLSHASFLKRCFSYLLPARIIITHPSQPRESPCSNLLRVYLLLLHWGIRSNTLSTSRLTRSLEPLLKFSTDKVTTRTLLDVPRGHFSFEFTLMYPFFLVVVSLVVFTTTSLLLFCKPLIWGKLYHCIQTVKKHSLLPSLSSISLKNQYIKCWGQRSFWHSSPFSLPNRFTMTKPSSKDHIADRTEAQFHREAGKPRPH